jgi:hypothetical protein
LFDRQKFVTTKGDVHVIVPTVGKSDEPNRFDSNGIPVKQYRGFQQLWQKCGTGNPPVGQLGKVKV